VRVREIIRVMTKRVFDICFSVLLIVFLLPFLIIICILVAVKLGRPVFFIQERPGLNGKCFKMVKFRSMNNDIDSKGDLLSNKQRTSKFGQLIRGASLDELPELWNVIKGDMSLVGPRPLKTEYLELYNEHQKRRHDVKPGITGWAQINGRNSASWQQRFDMDVWYVEHQSLWLDITILFKTMKKVISKEGVDHTVDEVAGRFLGNLDD